MPIVAVYFRQPGDLNYPFHKEYYLTAYRELDEEIRSFGGRMIVVRTMETHIKGNTFARYSEFRDGQIVGVDEEITADIIYDKGHFKPDDESFLMNDPELDKICTDKWKTYELFPNHCPVTIIVRSSEEIKSALEKIPGELVVAKPIDGAEGKGVSIVPRVEIAAVVTSFPYLLQEYMDLSGGIPGIIDGTHDFRLIVINGEVVLSFIRTPPPGSLLANVSQGGKLIEVPVSNIPNEPLAILKKVDEILSRFPRRVYSVDLGRNIDGTWKIIELNSMPGCPLRSEGPDSIRFQKALAELLVRSAKEEISH